MYKQTRAGWQAWVARTAVAGLVGLSMGAPAGCTIQVPDSNGGSGSGGSNGAGSSIGSPASSSGGGSLAGGICGNCPRQVPANGALCLGAANCEYPQAHTAFRCYGAADVWREDAPIDDCPSAKPAAGAECLPPNSYSASYNGCSVCEYAQGCNTPITTMLCDQGHWFESPLDATSPRIDTCGQGTGSSSGSGSSAAGIDVGNHAAADSGALSMTDAGAPLGTDSGSDAGDPAAFCKSCLGALAAAHPGCHFYYPSLAGWGLCMECPDGTVPYRFIDVPGGGTAFTPPGHEGGQCPGCAP
jgi:hypothetical protein